MNSRDGISQRRNSEKTSGEGRKSKKRKSEERRCGQLRKKVVKSQNTMFLPMICGSGGLTKAAGAEPSGQIRDEKLHAGVERSTFGGLHVENTAFPDPFWKLRCRKNASPLWREANLQVKMYKAHHAQITFRS